MEVQKNETGGIPMAKEFIDELIDGLNALHLSEVQRLHDAVENRERLPLILTPAVVMKTVHRVAMQHQMTGEELMQLLGSRELSAAEAIAMKELASQLEKPAE